MLGAFRLVAWNIRAGGGMRREQIRDGINDLSADAVILSEFRSTPPSQWLAGELASLGLVHQSSTVDQVGHGVNALLIASRSPLRPARLRQQPREAGRWRAVQLEQPRLLLGGMHVLNQHTGRKPDFHDAVLGLMRRWRNGPAVFAGDTNSGRRGEDEQTRVFTQPTSAWFDLIHEAGWRDAFRLVHGQKREYTWYSPGHGNGFRLDQAFVSPDLADRILDVQHIWIGGARRRDAVSDHAAVVLDLDVPSA